MPLHGMVGDDAANSAEINVNPLFVREERDSSVPRNKIPPHGLLPDAALQLVRDELILDGNARLNLATSAWSR